MQERRRPRCQRLLTDTANEAQALCSRHNLYYCVYRGICDRGQAEPKEMVDDLLAKADSLEQQLGPDYAMIVDEIGNMDPTSEEGKKFTAVRRTSQTVR